MARVLFVVEQLRVGGAERQLLNLAKGLARAGHGVAIAVWHAGGGYEKEIEGSGIVYEVLKQPRRFGLPALIRNARAFSAAFRPHVIHGYLETGNFLSTLLDSPEPGWRLAWGVRASDLDLSNYDRRLRVVSALNRVLCRRADVIIANSQAGAANATALHYPADRVVVIHNGIDTERFRHDAAARVALRGFWGVRPGEKVIGMAARLDPVKGYDTFVAAARILAQRRPDVHFVCAGEGVEPYRGRVLAGVRAAGLERFTWLGPVEDTAAFYSALDLATCTSKSEGFSNALAEAMACGIPCVATDVGDSARVLGDTGIVVPALDTHALAAAWEAGLDGRAAPPVVQCRSRVVERFGLARLVAETEAAILPPELPRLAAAAAASVH